MRSIVRVRGPLPNRLCFVVLELLPVLFLGGLLGLWAVPASIRSISCILLSRSLNFCSWFAKRSSMRTTPFAVATRSSLMTFLRIRA